MGETPALPMPLFNRPWPKGLTGWCFGYGQLGHYQANCTWVKSFRGTQVGPSPPARRPGQFFIPLTLNVKQVEALIDTGYGRTLGHKARGPFTSEQLRIQCIHGDIREYRTKLVSLGIGRQTFTYRVGVVPRFDCSVLIGRDCPILA